MKPRNSETTGEAKRDHAGQNSIGQQHGETVSGTSLTVSENEKRAWLVARSPEAVDAALLTSVASSFGAVLNVVSENRFPEDGPAYRVAVTCGVQVASVEQARAAAERFQGAMIPATASQAEEWFYALRLATAGAAKSEMDEEARMALYVNAMARYPADVARAALSGFMTRTKGGTAWFPTLAELIAEADKLVAPRQVIIAGLLAWRPKTPDEERQEDARELLFQAVEKEREAFPFKRSDHAKYTAMMGEAKALRTKAAETRRGGPKPEASEAF